MQASKLAVGVLVAAGITLAGCGGGGGGSHRITLHVNIAGLSCFAPQPVSVYDGAGQLIGQATLPVTSFGDGCGWRGDMIVTRSDEYQFVQGGNWSNEATVSSEQVAASGNTVTIGG